MTHIVRCSCGAVFRGQDEEELYSLIRHHLQLPHPETHHPVIRPSADRVLLVESEVELDRDHRDAFEVALAGHRG